MLSDQISKQLFRIDQTPSLLISASCQTHESIQQFIKNWYTTCSSAQIGMQQSYVWSLVYGWPLQQLNKSLMTTTLNSFQSTFLREQLHKLGNFQNISLNQQQNILQYISKNQIFIKFQNNYIWINPSSYIQNISWSINTMIFVITNSNIRNLLNFLEIIRNHSNIRLITTEHIYRKIIKLIDFLNSTQNNLKQPQTYLLKPQQYFEYANIIWLIRQNCWYQSSCDLTITFNHTKQTFLIEGEKLTQTKLIYYGWKKNLITQQNYQKYIRQWDKTIIKPSPLEKNLFKIPSIEKNNKKDKNYWYLHFIKKELIDKLTPIEQDQLFACCQLVQLIPNQIISKKNYLFDYMYILLEGQFELRQCKDVPQNKKADPKLFYGLNELTTREPTYNFTLASIQKGSIFRIQKSNVLFHLYDLLI